MSQAPPMTEAVANVASEDTKASLATRDAYPAEMENSLDKPDLLQCSNVVYTHCIKIEKVYVCRLLITILHLTN